MDTKTPEERSRNMAAVRNKNTAPEMRLRRAAWRAGLRYFTSAGWYRLTGHRLPGTPDLVFPAARVAVFVDGCFWHGCPQHYEAPETRQEFWSAKVRRNMERDHVANELLRAEGWKVIRFWEHDLTVRALPSAVCTLATFLGRE
jgi:DNA mismatch endonuclease (patch repair protein)